MAFPEHTDTGGDSGFLLFDATMTMMLWPVAARRRVEVRAARFQRFTGVLGRANSTPFIPLGYIMLSSWPIFRYLYVMFVSQL